MDYEKILKGIVQIINTAENSDIGFANICDYIGENCPELQESDDERIRKELITHCRNIRCVTEEGAERIAKWLAWLEKQGEQKSVDKVKPKFHKDDWVVNNDTGDVFQVNEIRDGKYCLWPIDSEIVEHLRIIAVDTDYHLWSIQEAKDGDVLTDVYGNIGIYEKCDDFNWTSYCSLGHNGGFQPFEVEHENEKTYPATKTQRDTLFTKMKEAGYEWDAEKKKSKRFEKQGEQKLIIDGILTATNYDKMFQNCNVRKFKVGDWVMLDRPVLITKVEDMPYNTHQYWTSDGTWFGDATKSKLWTIEDAKDGDVLVHNDCIFIFMGIKDGIVKGICTELSDTMSNFGKPEYNNDYCPATKEQRDALMRVITDFGYEWDAEKKELKKIEQKSEKPKWSDDDEQYLLVCKNALSKYQVSNKWDADIISKWLDDKLKQGEQKPTWSEEDEKMVKDIIAAIDTLYPHGMVNWLKSLKYRVQPQLKYEWDEEDNKRIDRIYDFLWKHKRGFSAIIWQIEEDANWLKLLKNKVALQKQWKPSKEQIIALRWVLNNIPYNKHKEEISELLDQIKDL